MEIEHSAGVLEEYQIDAGGCCGFQNSIQGQFNFICYRFPGDIELGRD
jgi:hypothetical protein